MRMMPFVSVVILASSGLDACVAAWVGRDCSDMVASSALTVCY